MFKIKKVESSNKTIRLPNDLIEQLESIAAENDVSFNQVVTQCCQYALDHMETPAVSDSVSPTEAS